MQIDQRDFIIVGQQPWDNPIGSNCIDIAEEIARHNRVLYINPPVDRISLLRKNEDLRYVLDRRKAIVSGERDKMEKVREQLWVYSPTRIIESLNMLPDGGLYDFLNKRNNRIYAKEISQAISTLDFKNFLLFNDGDMFRSFYLKDYLKPQVSIYYTRDYFLAVDYWKKHGERLEPALMKKSDLVVSNSIYLNNLASQYNSNAHYIGQGCDFSMFNPEEIEKVPEELEAIAHPRIGYIGALLNLRLDIELLENLARAKPQWQIVLIGPEDEHFKQSELHGMENVHFLGSKPMDTLGAYLKGFDVALNPQKFNEVTIGNYPRKIDEYLAMGTPTVATATETMEAFKDHVYLGKGLADYLRLITRALDEDDAKKQKARRDFALQHTWENSVNAMYEAILKTPAYRGN